MLMEKRGLIALLLLSSWCIVPVIVLWLFLMVPWVGLQCVIVVFSDYPHIPFSISLCHKYFENIRYSSKCVEFNWRLISPGAEVETGTLQR